MVAKDFEVGDLVWAKMKGYPDWPARIESPPAGTAPRKAKHYVYFFGSENYSWIPDENIKHHSEEMIKNRSKLKRADYEKGIEEIMKESQTSPPKKPKSPVKQTNEKKEKEVVKPKLVKHVNKVSKENGEKSKKTVLKPVKKRRLTNENKSSPPAKVQKSSYSSLYDNVLPSIGFNFVDVIAPEEKENTEVLPSQKIIEIDQKMGESSKALDKKGKKIGFLGLGMMGTGMVRNLINSGHDMMIWNRTNEKCNAFKDSGAVIADSPADVVKHCDITFCCVSDPHAVKTIIFEENGVLKGFESCERKPKGETKTKGYVEMTSIDAETSQAIADSILHLGMKYLEAPIIGSKKRAEDGTILILGSGDRELFNDCESCFHAMSNHAYYISCEVGKSANINIITSMFLGTVYAALAEALSLTERLKLSQNDLLEILALRGITSPLLMEKGKAILDKNFVPDTYLKHQQKDLELAVNLSNTCDQSMPVSTAANEIFKHARRLGCSDFDTAAVYHGVWF